MRVVFFKILFPWKLFVLKNDNKEMIKNAHYFKKISMNVSTQDIQILHP